MTDDELDRVLATASPIGEPRVAALDLDDAEQDLLREILATAQTAAAPSPRRPALGRRRRAAASRRRTLSRRPLGHRLLAGAAAAASVASALVLGGGTQLTGESRRPAFAAEAIRVAEANPRLLVTLPGWTVSRADEFRADNGEMTFSRGDEHFDVHWRPAEQYDGYVEDRSHGNPSTQITLLGEPATRFRYAGSTDFTTFLPAGDETFAEIRANLGSLERYMEVLNSLRRVDVQTWLSALPASTVRPDRRADVVDAMLKGIPLPPGLDLGAVRDAPTVSDRYQLGAHVAGAVACRWLHIWSRALVDGEEQRAALAVQAMQTARRWPILLEMEAPGDYPEVLWMLADRMKAGTLERDSYERGLGCEPGPG